MYPRPVLINGEGENSNKLEQMRIKTRYAHQVWRNMISQTTTPQHHNSRSKGFDGIHLILFHLGGVTTLDDGHTLAGMDLIWADAMAVEVANALDGIGLAIELNFITLHFIVSVSYDR